MKIWVDDVREMPSTYTEDDIACKSTWETMEVIEDYAFRYNVAIEEISFDHDSGDESPCGGDYINVLKWLEWYSNFHDININKYIKCFKFHSKNPVGVDNMIAICKANGWNYE